MIRKTFRQHTSSSFKKLFNNQFTRFKDFHDTNDDKSYLIPTSWSVENDDISDVKIKHLSKIIHLSDYYRSETVQGIKYLYAGYLLRMDKWKIGVIKSKSLATKQSTHQDYDYDLSD